MDYIIRNCQKCKKERVMQIYRKICLNCQERRTKKTLKSWGKKLEGYKTFG